MRGRTPSPLAGCGRVASSTGGPRRTAGCPQAGDGGDSGRHPVDTGIRAGRPPLRRRQVEELSPGMCTPWGDRDPGVTQRTGPARGTGCHPQATPQVCTEPSSSPLTWAFVRSHRPQRAVVPGPSAGPVPGLGTNWGRTREGRGTARGRRTVGVHGRRDVHVSTTAVRSLPTVDQHVDSGADLRGGVVSPASTPVMTEMKERDRGFLEPQ